jgi:hypothetical protein
MGEVDGSEIEIPVNIGDLEVAGTRPQQGDPVDFKVNGTVTRIVNDCVYCTCEEVNDKPLEKPIKIPSMGSEMDKLGAMAESADEGREY